MRSDNKKRLLLHSKYAVIVSLHTNELQVHCPALRRDDEQYSSPKTANYSLLLENKIS